MACVSWMGFSRLISRVPFGVVSSNELCRQVACSASRQSSGQLHLTSNYVQHERRCSSTLQSSHQAGRPSELLAGSDISTGVTEAINAQLKGGSAGRLFAVVHLSGKQRKITTDDIIILDKPIEADVGERIRLNKVLLVGGQDFTIVGRPVLNARTVRVEATVIEKTLSHTRVAFWYYKRQNHRVFRLRKDSLTVLRINDIDVAALDHSARTVRVEATVIEKTLSHTRVAFWYYKRQNHRVFRLRKDSLTVLRINDIDVAALDHS